MRSSELDEGERVLATALSMLGRRDLTVAQLTRKLDGRGIDPDLVQATVLRLREAGYLDDRRFARTWAESALVNGRGYGPRLRLDLARRGVPPEIAAEVLSTLAVEYDEMSLLTAIMARRFAGFNPLCASDREKRRVMQYLQRRGFSAAAIWRAFRMEEDF